VFKEIKLSFNKIVELMRKISVKKADREDPEIYIEGSGLSLRTTNQKNHVDLSFYR
jgi:hypothetical protein